MTGYILETLVEKYVAIKSFGEISIHAHDASGNYATLCGLDGDDQGGHVDQICVPVPKGRKIDCEQCKAIFLKAREYTKRDFEI